MGLSENVFEGSVLQTNTAHYKKEVDDSVLKIWF